MDGDSRTPRWDGSRLSSSSFTRQGWSRLSPHEGHAGPSHYASWQHYESFADYETFRDPQSSALREVHEDTQHSDRAAANLTSGRLSTLPTRPVLVRAYSGNAEDEPRSKSSTMSPRRLFPFTGSRSSGSPLPSDKDFSIDSILQAIDPDIRGTLDSIAEICGRSKLSLANEYGSHIAPLGEIRAPPTGGLVPVEEASSSEEGRADEGVVIFDEDPGVMDTSRDMHPFSFYRYLENLRHAASALERNGGSTSIMAAQSAIMNGQSASATGLERDALPVIREFPTGPKNSSRDLLGKHQPSGNSGQSSQDIATPAIISEVHFDARADDQHIATEPRLGGRASGRSTPDTWNTSDVVQSLLGWLKWTTRVVEPDSRPALQSAEDRLRAMLGRADDENTSLPAA
ncbi:uncharacterized protein N7473_003614 [Penicillium subrubescens]|uniref:Uncharacterized protein n=1 Tax=Penicillium subrubescens TaxID=1316194 RepID=A0A1Q5TL80_9EURO|nr:uncharacterized protein N7473_003614 [Penicillium subrubescens]KAJ5906698.1 hypothetical protein N7473_003614 [Penicillium subrubescens]OKP00991.1 hypothetical protein PENSUB_7572 [Penicillium subrubescens]